MESKKLSLAQDPSLKGRHFQPLHEELARVNTICREQEVTAKLLVKENQQLRAFHIQRTTP